MGNRVNHQLGKKSIDLEAKGGFNGLKCESYSSVRTEMQPGGAAVAPRRSSAKHTDTFMRTTVEKPVKDPGVSQYPGPARPLPKGLNPFSSWYTGTLSLSDLSFHTQMLETRRLMSVSLRAPLLKEARLRENL